MFILWKYHMPLISVFVYIGIKVKVSILQFPWRHLKNKSFLRGKKSQHLPNVIKLCGIYYHYLGFISRFRLKRQC